MRFQHHVVMWNSYLSEEMVYGERIGIWLIYTTWWSSYRLRHGKIHTMDNTVRSRLRIRRILKCMGLYRWGCTSRESDSFILLYTKGWKGRTLWRWRHSLISHRRSHQSPHIHTHTHTKEHTGYGLLSPFNKCLTIGCVKTDLSL